MANILLGEQNKELLWNILYSNKTFESIPQSKFNSVKTIFENAIIKVVNANLEMLESTTNVHTVKSLITQLNKVILQNMIEDIANFNQLLLSTTNVKENYKTDTLETFEKQYKEKTGEKFSTADVFAIQEWFNSLPTKDRDGNLKTIASNSMKDIADAITQNKKNSGDLEKLSKLAGNIKGGEKVAALLQKLKSTFPENLL